MTCQHLMADEWKARLLMAGGVGYVCPNCKAWVQLLKTVPPEDAQPGDPCGLLIATGADGQADICPGMLECYIDVHGKVPGCECHLPPPCGACLDAPVACATCLETVP